MNTRNDNSFADKRTILVVDDEFVNQEILCGILKNEFHVLRADDGQQALELIWENSMTLSLVLLDLLMPVMKGFEVLHRMKEDPVLSRIPVIVLTSDAAAEIECLKLGAIDFISKPYPPAGVILARVRRTIELSEDRQIIGSTERDPLTRLYNREYFYHYARQMDHRREQPMDAVVLDIYGFRLINERYGKTRGDELLRRVAAQMQSFARETGGIVCRREADTFMAYLPHREDYQALLDEITQLVNTVEEVHTRLRMGVYADVDKALDVERRFDHAQSAADAIRGSLVQTLNYYDEALHERELYFAQLIEDFRSAIQERQFVVYFQPKFDIRGDVPLLSSAEALVRWQHPQRGLISPGDFIPLFEANGLIRELDRYVWRETARQIRDWKQRCGFAVPVSVNVSRINMYDAQLVDCFRGILRDYDLSPNELLLEITESAYSQDSSQIINTVNLLRDFGFQIEMDDFGTGYSSLNMISSLPIDALKLDMRFIRDAFRDGRDTRLIEFIIEIADYLSVPVIAEGVETEQQLLTLKSMGCQLVQGFYFSRPVPAAEFERFLLERRRDEERDAGQIT